MSNETADKPKLREGAGQQTTPELPAGVPPPRILKARKSPRLRSFDYIGMYAYNLTFVTRERFPFFDSAPAVSLCLRNLLAAAERHDLEVLAYCFMADHVHVLAQGQNVRSSLTDFAKRFKQLSGFHFKQAYGDDLWQISYYDHVVRREESLDVIAGYIWDNPVRAGLVENRMAYAFSGPREFMGQE